MYHSNRAIKKTLEDFHFMRGEDCIDYVINKHILNAVLEQYNKPTKTKSSFFNIFKKKSKTNKPDDKIV